MMKLSPFNWASFNFFGYFCAYGVMLPFLPVWLKHYGYGAEMIGLIASVGYIFRLTTGKTRRSSHSNRSWLNLAKFSRYSVHFSLCG